VVSKAFGRV